MPEICICNDTLVDQVTPQPSIGDTHMSHLTSVGAVGLRGESRLQEIHPKLQT